MLGSRLCLEVCNHTSGMAIQFIASSPSRDVHIHQYVTYTNIYLPLWATVKNTIQGEPKVWDFLSNFWTKRVERQPNLEIASTWVLPTFFDHNKGPRALSKVLNSWGHNFYLRKQVPNGTSLNSSKQDKQLDTSEWWLV